MARECYDEDELMLNAVHFRATRAGLRGWTFLTSLSLGVMSPCLSAHAAKQLLKLTPSDGAAGDQFGYSVLLSQGDLFVGAPRKNNSNGVVYAYLGDLERLRSPVLFEPPSGTKNSFGTSVVRQGDTLIIGSPRSQEGGVRGGAAYVYQKNSQGGWSLTQTLTPQNGVVNQQFGMSMALSGDVLLVGAPRRAVQVKDDNGQLIRTQADAGAVFVFERQGGGPWQQVGDAWVADDPGRFDQMGSTLALDGSLALVGAPGADVGSENDAGSVYAYRRQGSGAWTRIQTITAPQVMARAKFGTSVDLRQGQAVIGAPSDSVSGSRKGSVYAMNFAQNAWRSAQRLDPAKDFDGLLFGTRVAMSPDGQSLAVGVPGESSVATNNGEVQVYRRETAERWSSQPRDRARPADVDDRDSSGSALSLLNDGLLAVGVRNDDDLGSLSGSAYLFRANVGEDLPVAPVAPMPWLLLGGWGLCALRRRDLD